jgi:hypothetical protein
MSATSWGNDHHPQNQPKM